MKRLLLLTSVLVGIPALTILAGPAQAAHCLTSDVSLTIAATSYAPTKCADNVANGNPSAETANLNAALGTTGFAYLDKTEGAAGPALSGIQFTVKAPAANNGIWTLAWADTNGSAPLNLPITIDFEIALFGGNYGSGYLFDNVLLPISPASGTGTFDINFTNNGGQQPGLSHLTLIGGNVAHVDPPVTTAEPASMAILGLGTVALGFLRRRRH